jgi:hypothetical protein
MKLAGLVFLELIMACMVVLISIFADNFSFFVLGATNFILAMALWKFEEVIDDYG